MDIEAGQSRMDVVPLVARGRAGPSFYHLAIWRRVQPKSLRSSEVPATVFLRQGISLSVSTLKDGLWIQDIRRLLHAPSDSSVVTFGDLVGEAIVQAHRDAVIAGLPDEDKCIEAGGVGARAYSEGIGTYLAFALDRLADYNCA